MKLKTKKSSRKRRKIILVINTHCLWYHLSQKNLVLIFFFVDLMSALHSELCNADITQSGTYCAVPDWWCSGSFSPSCFVLFGFCLPLFFFDNRPLPRTRGSVILCRNYGARAWLSAKLPKLRREDEANCEVTLIGTKIEVPW